jgi:hypothetical protein
MSVQAISISSPWLAITLLAGLFLLCGALFLRDTASLRKFFACGMTGVALAFTYNFHIRLDGDGVTQTDYSGTRTLAWRDVAAVRFETRSVKGGKVQDLRLVGRSGGDIVVDGIDGLGRDDAATLGDFLQRRLSGPTAGQIGARLRAMQSRDADLKYHFVAEPNA